MITPHTKPLGVFKYFHECLGHPEHQSRGGFWKFALCHYLFPGHLRERSLFLTKTQNESCQGPSWEVVSSPSKLAAGSLKHCSLPEDWESGAGRPLGSFLKKKSIQWGVYWNSSVPFLLFVTNSHGSVFTVLFFFSVFFFFLILFPLLGDKIGHLNKVLF